MSLIHLFLFLRLLFPARNRIGLARSQISMSSHRLTSSSRPSDTACLAMTIVLADCIERRSPGCNRYGRVGADITRMSDNTVSQRLCHFGFCGVNLTRSSLLCSFVQIWIPTCSSIIDDANRQTSAFVDTAVVLEAVAGRICLDARTCPL